MTDKHSEAPGAQTEVSAEPVKMDEWQIRGAVEHALARWNAT